METQDFGTFLRRAREERTMSLAEVARRTKVAPATLQMLESGSLDDLPPEVFVRGFIRSYARALGISDAEPLGLFEKALAARRPAEELPPIHSSPMALPPPDVDEENGPNRRGIGLAVLVIILLLIATVTLSLYLRQPPQSGEGLSSADGTPGHFEPSGTPRIG